MNVNYLTLLSIILLSSCTVNQTNRIHEFFTQQTGAYPRVKDIQVVAARYDTQDFSLHFREGSSLSTRKGTYPVFVLKAESLPLHERFIFARIDRVTGVIDPECEFEVLEDGNLEIYGRRGISHEKEIPFVVSEGLKAGYPIDYAIVSKKTYASTTAEFMPYPIEAYGPGGEKIEAIVSHPMCTHFEIRAQGFLPFEKLGLSHTSDTITEEIEMTADQNGSFAIGLNPTILGKLGGDAYLIVKRSDGREDLTLNYPWGTGIEKKTWQERTVFPILFVANHDPDEHNHIGLTALLE